MSESTKYLLITHSKSCMDGRMCAAIYTRRMRELGVSTVDYEIKFTQYEEDDLDLETVRGKHVIIADFSYPSEILEGINKLAKTFQLFDHHELPQKTKDLTYTTISNDKCGSMLLWDYFYPGVEAPMLLSSVDARDRWTTDRWIPNTFMDHEVAAALLLIKYNDYDQILGHFDNTDALIERGRYILEYQRQSVKKIEMALKYKRVMMVTLNGGHQVPLINATTLISEIGNMASSLFPAVVMFFMTDTKIVFSFRSSEENPETLDGIAEGFFGHTNACATSCLLSYFDYRKVFVEKRLDMRELAIAPIARK